MNRSRGSRATLKWTIPSRDSVIAAVRRPDKIMRAPQFSLLSLIAFISLAACFIAVSSIPRPQVRMLGRLIGEPSCHKMPFDVCYGFPFTARTDSPSYHEPHVTGPCKFNSTYHTIGLMANLAFGLVGSVSLIATVIYTPKYASWLAFLNRERKMIDAAVARR